MKKLLNLAVFGLVVTALVLTSNFSFANAQTNSSRPGTNLPFPKEQNNKSTTSDGVIRYPVVSDDSTTTFERKNEIKAKIFTKEKVERLQDGSQNFLENFKARFEKTIQNLFAVHSRISTLADRIDSRIEKLKIEKIDTTASAKFITAAREDLRLAKISIEAAEASFKIESIAKPEPTPGFPKPNTQSKEIFSTDGFKKCVAFSGLVQTTAPERCVLEGSTFVNSDQGPAVEISAASKINSRSYLTKTLENTRAAKEHLKNAHQNLVEAIKSLKSVMTVKEENNEAKPEVF